MIKADLDGLEVLQVFHTMADDVRAGGWIGHLDLGFESSYFFHLMRAWILHQHFILI